VVADDPLRSVHSLPGVAADDDFHATFACRGLGFATTGFYIDGVLTNAPFHTVRDDEESLGGSITILSGDLVESLSLMSGGAPARYGDRVGSVLSVRTREGAREFTARVNLSLAGGISGTMEGPWPGTDRGAWLVSARKSYLGYVAERVVDETPLLDYYDLQAKLSYRPSPAHRVSVFILHGDFETVRRDVPRLRLDVEAEAHTRTSFGRVQWEWQLGGKGSLAATAFATTETGAHRNRVAQEIAGQDSTQTGLRVDLTYPLGKAHRLEAGILARQIREGQQHFTAIDERQPPVPADRYDVDSAQPGAYVQDTWTLAGDRLALTAGLRADALGATREMLWLPRAGATLKLGARTALMAHAGEYGQFPRFVHLVGPAGNPGLHAERSRQIGLGVERSLGPRTRLRVEVYDQRVRQGLFTERRETRLVGDFVAPRDDLARLRNALAGTSRGIEVLLQRRSANGVSGWVSYAFGRARFQDGANMLPEFDADFDQRHTVSVYLSGRVSRSVHVSTKYRYGSGFPLPGFYRDTPAGIVMAVHRNEVRRKGYGRWDIRANKVFTGRGPTFTVYAEVMNVLNTENVRVERIGENFVSRAVFVREQRLFPILPAVGLAVEF
jgi:hypothetical protein